jgi:hypothetical protein
MQLELVTSTKGQFGAYWGMSKGCRRTGKAELPVTKADVVVQGSHLGSATKAVRQRTPWFPLG